MEIGFLAKRTHVFFQGLEARAERDVNGNRYVAEKKGKGERKGREPGRRLMGRLIKGLLMPGWLEIILEKMSPLNCFELVITSIK